MPDVRVVNHFHNPLATTWSGAGLRVVGIQPGQSSVIWQQNTRQSEGIGGASGTWSWPVARQAYFEALTSGAESDRKIAFAKLFRSLGQVMHLVQDASLPAHTRNGPHLYKVVLGLDLGDPDRYERWVDKRKPSELAPFLDRPTVRPSERVFSRIGTSPRIDRSRAPSPVSGLIDTGQYDGTNPDVTATPPDGRPVIGLAEYSNANFFSNNTIFADKPALFGVIPFPSGQSMELGPLEPAPGAWGGQRRYLLKARHGDTNVTELSGATRHYRLALPGALYDYLPEAIQARNSTIDEKVTEDLGALLLPRAVGYSAALIDYFFRGSIAATDEQNPQDVRIRTFTVVNGSPDEDVNGTFALYVEPEDGTRTFRQSWSLSLSRGQSTAVPVQRLPIDTPPTTRCILVFRGQLGQEDDAVAGGFVPCPLEVPPPAPPSQTLWTCRLFGVRWQTSEYQLLETRLVATDDAEVPPQLIPPYIDLVATYWDCRH